MSRLFVEGRVSSCSGLFGSADEGVVLSKASALGYEGTSLSEAKQYIEELHSEIQRISELSWRRFCNLPEGTQIDRSFYVRDFFAQESLNVSAFYSLILGKKVCSWEFLSQYLLKRFKEGTLTDHEYIHQSIKAFCLHLTSQQKQKCASDLLHYLGAGDKTICWEGEECQSLLKQAVADGRFDVVSCFLLAGYERRDLLKLAVESGQLDLVKKLLDDDEEGVSILLLIAVDGEHEQLATYLVTRGADVNHMLSGETLLSLYTKKNRLRCVQILTDLGADVHKKNEAGQTPLACALESGNHSIAQFLLGYYHDLEGKIRELMGLREFYKNEQKEFDMLEHLIKRSMKAD